MIIKIHSFIDVITNSSTEIYVAASENTIKTVKELVNSLIKLSGGTQTADDLFTFELIEEYLEEYTTENLDEMIYEKLSDEIENWGKLNYTERNRLTEEFEAKNSKEDWFIEMKKEATESAKSTLEERGSDISMSVEPKDDTDKNVVFIAKILSDLDGLFATGEVCN